MSRFRIYPRHGCRPCHISLRMKLRIYSFGICFCTGRHKACHPNGDHWNCYPSALSFIEAFVVHFGDRAPVDEIYRRLIFKWVADCGLHGRNSMRLVAPGMVYRWHTPLCLVGNSVVFLPNLAPSADITPTWNPQTARCIYRWLSGKLWYFQHEMP